MGNGKEVMKTRKQKIDKSLEDEASMEKKTMKIREITASDLYLRGTIVCLLVLIDFPLQYFN